MAYKRRSSSSFSVLLLMLLNFILFILSSASIAPIFLLKYPPSSFGWALFMVSCISLLASLVGFCSQITHLCFITHVSLALASATGQVLAILALFTRENSSLRSLNSPRDPKEARLLVRVECGALMGMLMIQVIVVVLTCAVHSCWVKEFEVLEVEKEETAKKRSRNLARVQEESMANAAKIADARAKELDEKMKYKYGQWIKTDFQG
ncbi:Membrane lipoprotein [Thalictrum thalictroides]|uniref:Membrane lipoprotein n=1 Tax=Thalictrum thalictroides TaxID=46969 RepID=A0A7J6VSX1_THATH|nr:Membrane lipoprotein [Thalictrum thalictroides]